MNPGAIFLNGFASHSPKFDSIFSGFTCIMYRVNSPLLFSKPKSRNKIEKQSKKVCFRFFPLDGFPFTGKFLGLAHFLPRFAAVSELYVVYHLVVRDFCQNRGIFHVQIFFKKMHFSY